ncbi:hypothetical protein FZ029_28810 [Azospirillum sp. Sh1]|nr:hypothetical protein FZ029_28810 [Azospirillum sp. Sh1]
MVADLQIGLNFFRSATVCSSFMRTITAWRKSWVRPWPSPSTMRRDRSTVPCRRNPERRNFALHLLFAGSPPRPTRRHPCPAPPNPPPTAPKTASPVRPRCRSRPRAPRSRRSAARRSI